MADNEFRKHALLTQLVEAWRDIRSYTSNVWQVAAVCLAVIGLVINALIGRIGDSTPIYETDIGWMLLVFMAVFLLISLRMFNWFLSVLSTRAHFIQQVEGQLDLLGLRFPSDEVPKYATTGDTHGQSWGYVFFYEGRAVPIILFLFFNWILVVVYIMIALQTTVEPISILPISIVTILVIIQLKLLYDTITLVSRRLYSMEVDSIGIQSAKKGGS